MKYTLSNGLRLLFIGGHDAIIFDDNTKIPDNHVDSIILVSESPIIQKIHNVPVSIALNGTYELLPEIADELVSACTAYDNNEIDFIICAPLLLTHAHKYLSLIGRNTPLYSPKIFDTSNGGIMIAKIDYFILYNPSTDDSI